MALAAAVHDSLPFQDIDKLNTRDKHRDSVSRIR